MQQDTVIEVSNLSKAFRIGLKEEEHESLVSAIVHFLKSPLRNFRRIKELGEISAEDNDSNIFWALRDVNFDIKQGEVVGIIGKNGAGKSTLLKVLSQITPPTSGRIEIKGRVASLLEVGTGFNEELTGRENVYLNGTILGMTKKEIDAKYDEIVNFSGVEKFMDTPVKRYSSGMRVRLAFAVAAHLEPEILIIDEVLAVGDAEFQRKCLGKMQDVAGQGRTVLFVSHNMAAVENLCTRCIVLAGGKVLLDGSVEEAINIYLNNSVDEDQVSLNLGDDIKRKGNGRIRFKKIELSSNGYPTKIFKSGDPLKLSIQYEKKIDDPIYQPRVRIAVKDVLGTSLFGCISDIVNTTTTSLNNNTGEITFEIPSLPLNSGTYMIDLWIKSNLDIEDWIENILDFSVEGGDFYGTGKVPPADCGHFLVKNTFSFNENGN